MPLKEIIPQTSWKGAQKEHITKLKEAISSLLQVLKQAAESKIDVLLGSGEIRKCLPMLVPFCWDISKAKNMSPARHGFEQQHSSVSCHSTYKDMVKSKESSSSMMAETAGTTRSARE